MPFTKNALENANRGQMNNFPRAVAPLKKECRAQASGISIGNN